LNLATLKYWNKSRIIFILVSLLIAILIIDVSIVKISGVAGSQYVNSLETISLFIFMACLYVIGQYVILKFLKDRIKNRTMTIGGRLSASRLHKIVTAAQLVVTAVLLFIVFRVVVYSQYYTDPTIAATLISYTMAAGMMVLLSHRLFLWFNENKNNLTVLLYAISSTALAANAAISFILLGVDALDKPAIISAYSGSVTIVFNDVKIPGASLLNPLYALSSVIGFSCMWIATALLLRSHSQKLGKASYWFTVSIPLIYFISQFATLFLHQLSPILASSPVLFTFIFILSKPVGGILFGYAFLRIAKASIPRENIVRDYMTLAGYGIMLFFVSSQNTIAQTPYPPFGLIAASLVGLSTYLVFIGVYSSAVSVSQDMKLRQSIRKSAAHESKLLESIGTAHMEQELQKRVLRIAKKNSDSMTEETGVQPSVSEDDIKQYLQEVIKEIRSERENKIKEYG
jgi:hypothetical protein